MASTRDTVFTDIVMNTQKSIASLAKLGVAVGAAVAAFKTVYNAVDKLVQAYGEQEAAERKLRAAIKATGREADIVAESIFDLASELQQVTTFGDEATIAAAAMVQQLANLDEQGLRKVIPGMQDFAAAMGISLETAATLIGKTLGSSTNALSRYGVELDATAEPTEKLAQLTQALTDKFGGMASELADTTLGQLAQLKNTWGDVFERMGEALTEFYGPAIGWLNDLGKAILGVADATDELGDAASTLREAVTFTDAMKVFHDSIMVSWEEIQSQENLGDAVQRTAIALSVAARKGLDTSAVIGGVMADAIDQATEAAERFGVEIQQIDAQRDLGSTVEYFGQLRNYLRDVLKVSQEALQPLQDVINALVAAGDDAEDTAESVRKIAGAFKEATVKMVDFTAERREMENAGAEGIDKYLRMISEQRKERDQAQNEEKEAAHSTAEAWLGAFRDVAEARSALSGLQKVAAVAEIAYNTAVAITEALKLPIYGEIKAAAIAIAGAAQAATVLSQPEPEVALARGGIITRPVTALIGEDGPEAVVPLNRGAFMGNRTVVINVGGTVVSEDQLRGFVAQTYAMMARGY